MPCAFYFAAMQSSPRHIGLSVSLLALVIATAAPAAVPYEETASRRHWYNSFIRPAKDNPRDQFTYAESLRTAGQLRAAGKQYRLLTVFWPESPEAPKAQLAYARTLDTRREWQDASEEYSFLIEHYPGTFPYNDILQRQFEIAETLMNTPKGKFLFFPGFTSPERAVPLFEKILEHGPEWEKAPEVQFLIGLANELSRQYELAVPAYLTTQVRYSDSPFAEKAAYHRALCLEHLSREEPNNEAALDEAWSAVHQFVTRYPSADQTSDMLKMRDDLLRKRASLAFDRAHYYDTIAHQPKAALIEYRDFVHLFPQSDWTAQAQQRIETLAHLVESTNENAHAAP